MSVTHCGSDAYWLNRIIDDVCCALYVWAKCHLSTDSETQEVEHVSMNGWYLVIRIDCRNGIIRRDICGICGLEFALVDDPCLCEQDFGWIIDDIIYILHDTCWYMLFDCG